LSGKRATLYNADGQHMSCGCVVGCIVSTALENNRTELKVSE